jgi:hypothetical protein
MVKAIVKREMLWGFAPPRITQSGPPLADKSASTNTRSEKKAKSRKKRVGVAKGEFPPVLLYGGKGRPSASRPNDADQEQRLTLRATRRSVVLQEGRGQRSNNTSKATRHASDDDPIQCSVWLVWRCCAPYMLDASSMAQGKAYKQEGSNRTPAIVAAHIPSLAVVVAWPLLPTASFGM